MSGRSGENQTSALAYTIGCLVTSREQFAAMRQSFEANGFTGRDCEFRVVDNTGPSQTCAFRGLNNILAAARGRRVILCHQDVRLLDQGRTDLDHRLHELEQLDPSWAVAGNAGGQAPGKLAMRITDPHGRDRHIGNLPARVASLDENFLVVEASTRVGFSNDLDGFHFYGTDICLVAETLGYSAYVVDFHLEHLSGGRKGRDFHASEIAFRNKWSRAFRSRWLQTTCSLVRVGGGSISRTFGHLASRPIAGVIRRLTRARGSTGRSRG